MNFAADYLEETGRNMDLAIDGAGFFNVQSEDGRIFLTRNGNFEIDGEGYLSLKGYGRVLGENGLIPVRSSDFIAAGDGTLYSADGEALGKLRISAPAADQLSKTANGMYTLRGGENPPYEDARLVQGSLCASNVDMQRELTQVMEAQRAFQACSNAVRTMYQMDQKSATKIAVL